MNNSDSQQQSEQQQQQDSGYQFVTRQQYLLQQQRLRQKKQRQNMAMEDNKQRQRQQQQQQQQQQQGQGPGQRQQQQQSEQQRQQRQRQQRQLLRRLRSRWSHWHRSRPETQRQLSQQSELRRRNLDDGEDETVENFRSRRGMYIKHFNKTFSRGYENSNILSKIFKRNNTISTLMIFYRPWWTRRMSFYNEYVFQDLMNGLRRNSYLSRLYIDGMLSSTSIESLSNMLSSNFSIKEFTLKLRDRLIGDGITFWKPWKPF